MNKQTGKTKTQAEKPAEKMPENKKEAKVEREKEEKKGGSLKVEAEDNHKKGGLGEEEKGEVLKLREEMGISDYLQEKFRLVVEQGLKQIVQNRPQDPIKSLGQYLIKKSKEVQ